jgi:tellurite resistance-related uncharacterized protein
MKQLPPDVTSYKRTPEFSESTVPKGLTRAHNTKEGTWALINVLEGELIYRILEPVFEEIFLNSKLPGVVEPTCKHEVEPKGKVRFFVEFYH